jgi:hypothetical protein
MYAPGISAVTLSTDHLCGIAATGQSISLISDGSSYHVWSSSCAQPLSPPAVPPSPPAPPPPAPPSLPPVLPPVICGCMSETSYSCNDVNQFSCPADTFCVGQGSFSRGDERIDGTLTGSGCSVPPDRLLQGQSLTAGFMFLSSDKAYKLIMQSDGNVLLRTFNRGRGVVYRNL